VRYKKQRTQIQIIMKVADKKVVVKNVKNVKAVAVKSEVVKKAEETTVWAKKMAVITAIQENKAKETAELKALAQLAKKRPGVIASILDFITASEKAVTQAQILEHLKAEFPKREESSMLSTIKAQIGGKKRPLRMEREKQVIFEIVSNKASVNVYSVAHTE
jgi:hypothetical protein